MANKDSTLRTFTVIGLLCFVCSILVCGTVVVLKPLQEKEMNADREKSVLEAAGIDYSGSNVSEVFAQKIEAKLLDLKTSAYVDSKTMREIVQCDEKKSDSDCAGSYVPVHIISFLNQSFLKRMLPFLKLRTSVISRFAPDICRFIL